MIEAASQSLRFDNLSQYLLLKNGNYLYKVPFRGDWAVLKVYFGDRSQLEYVTKSMGNILVCNQTSFMPKSRLKTEMEVLKLWRDAGIRVFETYDEVKVEGLPEGGYKLFEYVPGLKFVDYFADETVPLEDRKAMWRRFLKEWHYRHKLALDRNDPRFVHENGDLKHVMIWKKDLVYFDFEMVFRSKSRVKEFVGREILAFLKSLGKTVGEEHFDTFMKETVEHYPDTELLRYTHTYAFRNPNPVLRAARWLDRSVKPGAKKPFSKYNVARTLDKYLPPKRRS